MANIIFKPNQPVQSLSGTYGNSVFRTLSDGRTTIHLRPLDDDAPRPQRIIDHCTGIIQLRMGDMRDAISQRRAIQKRVRRLYARLYHLTESDDLLIGYILQAYFNTRRRLPSRARSATLPEVLSHPTRTQPDV